MKLSRKQLRRLIESVIIEQTASAGMGITTDMARPLIHAMSYGKLDKAEEIIQRLGTDDVTLNQIDVVYRKRYREMDNSFFARYFGLSPMGFAGIVEAGIASFIFASLAQHGQVKTEEAIESYWERMAAEGEPVPEEYVDDVQHVLSVFPGLLALFNTNR